MKTAHIVLGWICGGLFVGAGFWGAWCWRTVRHSPLFWRTLRAGQAAVVLEAGIGGLLVATGHKSSTLHLVYGILPILISFVAEQLRIASAQTVLDQRGIASAAAVGELPEVEQRSIVVGIMQRELGVMVLAALVIIVLLIRAAGTV